MRITENEDEMLLRDVPVSSWIMGIGGFFLFGGCFIWTILYSFYNPREFFSSQDGTWAGSAMAVIVYVFILVFVAALTAAFVGFILSSVTTVRIERKKRFVEITRRNLLRKNVKRFDFLQIKRFDIESRTVGRLGLTNFIALLLQNNRKIELEEKGFSDSDAEEIIERLNKFAGFRVRKKSSKMKTEAK